MLNMDLSEHLTDLEKFCLIIAAAVHDVAHPGLTNDFHIRCRDDVAFWYNDTSCNENLHARLAFEIASSSPRCDVFKSLGPELYPVVRRTLIQAILATDMQQHFLLLELFEREIENSGPNLSDWSDKVLVLKMALHLADLSNPARPVHLAQRWGHQVVAEMFRQGDVERSLGMPVSPVCDKDKVKVATAQMRFISYFLSPTVDAWGRVCPTFAGLASSMAARALDAWREYDRTVAQASALSRTSSTLAAMVGKPPPFARTSPSALKRCRRSFRRHRRKERRTENSGRTPRSDRGWCGCGQPRLPGDDVAHRDAETNKVRPCTIACGNRGASPGP